jgi:hypothetical protein
VQKPQTPLQRSALLLFQRLKIYTHMRAAPNE